MLSTHRGTINPLHTNINVHILHTDLYTFP